MNWFLVLIDIVLHIRQPLDDELNETEEVDDEGKEKPSTTGSLGKSGHSFGILLLLLVIVLFVGRKQLIYCINLLKGLHQVD